MSDLTVFVSTFNRIDTLTACVAALEAQERPKRIVIVDNGSRDPSAVRLLDELAEDYMVYRYPAIEDVPAEEGDDAKHGGESMSAVQRNISRAFREEWDAGRRPPWFGVTDADVSVDGRADSLDVFIRLAEKTGRAIGPHLQVNAHPNYPLRSAVMLTQSRVLFRGRMKWLGDIPYSDDPIDTTFHLFPSSPSFNRLGMETFRVGAPWWSTHLDWRIDVLNPTEENFAYILGCGEAASWGGRWIRGMFSAFIRSPEEAFALLEAERMTHSDYFYPGFMLSWMLQYGHGCEQDMERSREVLRAAIPDWSPCRDYEQHWDALVYGDDLSCLGWS